MSRQSRTPPPVCNGHASPPQGGRINIVVANRGVSFGVRVARTAPLSAAVDEASELVRVPSDGLYITLHGNRVSLTDSPASVSRPDSNMDLAQRMRILILTTTIARHEGRRHDRGPLGSGAGARLGGGVGRRRWLKPRYCPMVT